MTRRTLRWLVGLLLVGTAYYLGRQHPPACVDRCGVRWHVAAGTDCERVLERNLLEHGPLYCR